jgi:hypothetical protein
MARLSRRTIIQISLAAGLLAGLAGLAEIGKERTALGPTDGAGWRPVAWPFPDDVWPAGRAWRRDTTDVYVRLKPGLRGNCDTGVATDEELERVVDIGLLDRRFAPVQAGSRIRITDLFGRARLYRFKMKNGFQRFAEGIAVSYKCDLVIALIDGNVGDEQARKAVHRFLESNTVQVWVNKQLEGR